MRSPMDTVLANVIMTELEKCIIKPLIYDGTILFYVRYVDGTLLLVKKENITRIYNKFNSFHRNIKFTVDEFADDKVHFLDITILDDLATDIYRKASFTTQYAHFSSFCPWYHKIAWARSLISRSIFSYSFK